MSDAEKIAFADKIVGAAAEFDDPVDFGDYVFGLVDDLADD